MTEFKFYEPDWGDLVWSNWRSLDAGTFSEVPKEPGLYRIRHRNEERNFLEYIGESGDTRRRIQSLARGVFAEEMPYRDPHTAAPCLWGVYDNGGSGLEFSHTTPEKARNRSLRKGLEQALIALHRREAARSPTANYGRMIDGYKQSSYSYNEPSFKGRLLGPNEEEPNCASGVEPTDWQNWQNPVAKDWMGLNWSETYYLEQRLDVNPPDNGLYRIWHGNNAPPLTYIGESSNISSRLYNHEQVYGGDALFSYVERIDLDASHKRSEIETDLIGAHFLAVNEPPAAQFGDG